MSRYVQILNISHLVTKENLQELFQCCGEIVRMKISLADGQNVACIEFSDPTQAETANMLHGTELGDQKLQVTNIADEREAEALFENATEDAKHMTEYEKAVALIEQMKQGPVGAQEQRNNEVKRTVYLGNLSKTCTPEILKQEFSTVGEIVYIKFSGKSGTADFRYAFVEFANEDQARMAFTLHGKMICGQAIKVGNAHNPVFKDESQMNKALNAMQDVKRRVEREERHGGSRWSSERDRDRGSRRSRGRDRGRRRRRRRRDRSRSKDKEEEPKMFWDGYQWHFNDQNVEDVEAHVTKIIRDTGDRREPEKDTKMKMENAAQEALKTLKMSRAF